MHPKQKRVSRCKYKMTIRPQAAERRAQEKARKQQAASETKTDKEKGREARQGQPKNGESVRAAKEKSSYTGNSKNYFKKDVTMQ